MALARLGSAALHYCCLWENEVLGKALPWGAPDSARLSARLAGLLEVGDKT